MSNEIMKFENLTLIHETSRAYLVRDDTLNDAWIPKSQVDSIRFGKEIKTERETHKEILEINIPEWLAMNKGWM